MRNSDREIVDVDAYFADRGELTLSVTDALGLLGKSATDEERGRIVDYMQATRGVTFHAIAAVLGTCCHCAPCLRSRPSAS